MTPQETILRRFEELQQRLYDPALSADVEAYTQLMKEHARLQPLAEKIMALNAAKVRADEAKELLHGDDAELRALAAEEWRAADAEIARLEAEIAVEMRPRDPLDGKDLVIEIRAGVGGEEAALFAADLYRMYTMYAAAKGFTVTPAGCTATELGGYREVCFTVSGEGAYSRFRFESGTHRVQRVPTTETGGRIHTSSATVAVLTEAEEISVEIRPEDLQIDTYRSSGAGGQHINKTESAIRITHLPTGLVVECQDERSQYKNKDKAMQVLRTRLYDRQMQAQHDSVAADRKAQVGSGDRSERIRTYNFPQGRVTDHRIGLTVYRIDAVMDGDLDEIVDALAAAQSAAETGSGNKKDDL